MEVTLGAKPPLGYTLAELRELLRSCFTSALKRDSDESNLVHKSSIRDLGRIS